MAAAGPGGRPFASLPGGCVPGPRSSIVADPPEEPMSSTPRKRLAPEALVAGGVVVVLVVLVLAVFLSGLGSSLYPPSAVTTQARDVRGLYDVVFALAIAIFLAVEGLIVWSIIRYRRKPGDVDLPAQTHGNNLVEIIWTLIPTAIVLFLFVVSWQTLRTVDNVSSAPDIRIHAVAAQFQWQFEYLDADGKKLATQTIPLAADGGGMGVPVGKSVLVTLDSPDVIHAFYVPRFLFKRDVVPGQHNRFEFDLDASEASDGHQSVYEGQCAELCGTGHRTMLFSVVAMSPGDYDVWLKALIDKSNATPPPPPSGATAIPLAAQNVKFDKDAIQVPANQPFVIDFKNMDASTPHDVDIRQTDKTTVVEDQPITEGGKESQYAYKPLPAGSYVFICSIHPSLMSGTLTVQ
jgi:cytochrome c oxidase subunit 2